MSDYAPRRVVSLQPSATVILRDMGKLDCLVACTKYCAEVCPEVRGKTAIVADSWTAQSQQISKLHPDLVIAAVPYQEKAVTEILKSGARFLGLAPKSLADIYGDIAAIAGIMNAREEGMHVIEKMREAIEIARRSTQRLPRLRVFCEEWGKPLIASQLWVAELVEAAGGGDEDTSAASLPASPGDGSSEDELSAINDDAGNTGSTSLMSKPSLSIASPGGTGFSPLQGPDGCAG